MAEMKNEEYEKVKSLNSKHQFELLKMEEKLEQAWTDAHRLWAEEAEKKRQFEVQSKLNKHELKEDLRKSIEHIEEVKEVENEIVQNEIRRDYQQDLIALEKRLESALDQAMKVKDEEIDYYKKKGNEHK